MSARCHLVGEASRIIAARKATLAALPKVASYPARRALHHARSLPDPGECQASVHIFADEPERKAA